VVVAMGLQHWWKTGAAPNDYAFGLAEESFQGQPVAFCARSCSQPRSFGAFGQVIAAEDYRGKRIRFSAALKVSDATGWGGLFLRVDGPHLDETLAIDTMQDRPLVATTAGSSTRWCWTSRRRQPQTRSVPGCRGRGSCWCPSWPSRRSPAKCRLPPAPSATAAAEPRLPPVLVPYKTMLAPFRIEAWYGAGSAGDNTSQPPGNTPLLGGVSRLPPSSTLPPGHGGRPQWPRPC
jgi:hypothetical protein